MEDVAIVFPGQGVQTVGMGKSFYDSSDIARSIFDKADTIIEGLSETIFNGPQEKLTTTEYCQPGIFVCSLAIFEAFKACSKFSEYNPKFTAGLSLGEISAVTVSGSISFEEALKLVQKRALFMEAATQVEKGGMAAIIGFDKDRVIQICQDVGAEVANFNSPVQIVITGGIDNVQSACERIKEAGGKRVIPLDVSGAFHSGLMKSAEEPFKRYLDGTAFNEASFPVVSNVDGRPQTSAIKIKDNLVRQITAPVQWVDIVEHIKSQGVTTFLEIGPGSIVKGLIKKIDKSLNVLNINDIHDIS